MKLSNKNIFSLYIFTYLLVGVFLSVGYFESEAKIISNKESQRNESAFVNLKLEAKSAAIFDMAQNKFLYSKNPIEPLPLASLTKLMTALVASEKSDEISGEILVTNQAILEEGDNGLKSGEKWTLKSLSDFALIASSNDAAAAIAESFNNTPFVFSMNDEARRLGLSQTTFSNPTGLDLDKETTGARSNAYDVTKLLAYILKNKPEIVEATRFPEITFRSIDNFDHTAKNTNPQIVSLSGALASKTGFTDLAGGNLVVAFEVGPLRPIILTVLGSSMEGRFEDIQKLVEAVRRYYDH